MTTLQTISLVLNGMSIKDKSGSPIRFEVIKAPRLPYLKSSLRCEPEYINRLSYKYKDKGYFLDFEVIGNECISVNLNNFPLEENEAKRLCICLNNLFDEVIVATTHDGLIIVENEFDNDHDAKLFEDLIDKIKFYF